MTGLLLAPVTRHRASGGGGTPATSIALDASSSVATPDASAFAVTTLDIRVRFALPAWPPTNSGVLVAQFGSGSNKSWSLYVQNNSKPSLGISTTGSNTVFKAGGTAIPGTSGAMISLRATLQPNNGASGYDIKFYTSTNTDVASNSGWTQLGSTVTTSGAFTLPNSAASLQVCGDGNGDTPQPGNYTQVVLMDSIGGSVVANFDARNVTKTGTRTPATHTDPETNVWAASGSTWDWNT